VISFESFRWIWVLDFEYHAPPGEIPEPLCLVARELRSGRRARLWGEDLRDRPPLIGANDLAIAYFASAEIGCFLALGWPIPGNILDLYVEFRNAANGLRVPAGYSLLGALDYFGLPGMASAQKSEMRDLAIRGGPYSAQERRDLMSYCEADVDATVRVFERMKPDIDWTRALLRGQYMAAVAMMERTGIPIDTKLTDRLSDRWDAIRADLIEAIDEQYGVYDNGVFKRDRFESYLLANQIPWPRLPSGALALDDDTFRQMARADLSIAPLRELRASLSDMHQVRLTIGRDGRNRCLLSPFQSRTGRNQPSNSKFIFGTSVWLRGLIRPEAGMGLAYIDYAQQEFGIAAYLSGDRNMISAYESGDPYLSFARLAGAVPEGATKSTHPGVRERYKQCALAVLYGMGEIGLAQRLGITVTEARELIHGHRRAFPKFWRWSDAAVACAQLTGRLWTVFGWNLHVVDEPNPRSLANFPMQANGAEVLRLACTQAIRAGIGVCAPVHDAVLIEAPLGELDATVEKMRACMAVASAAVLGGPELDTDVVCVRYPDRFQDPRGAAMWSAVIEMLGNEPGAL
jgi:DNA polymerase-1